MSPTVDPDIVARYDAAVADISKVGWEQVDALVADALAFGEESAEHAYALGLVGRFARWQQERLQQGRDALERADRIGEARGIPAVQLARWLNTLAVVYDDLADARAAVDAAERSLVRTLEVESEIAPETVDGRRALVHTLRLALEPTGPELRTLAGLWRRLTDSERAVQRDCIRRIARRRADLGEQERALLERVTEEPGSLEALAPPPPAEADPPALAAVLAELDALVGLADVKAEVRRLAAVLEVEAMRRSSGLPVAERSSHFAFVGPPGTGKTTVARLLGRLFKALGLLATDRVVEVDRSGLVAGYVGQTALRVDEIVDSALDGVLFVDEAYALAPSSGNDFGHEAIATLLKRMEDDRRRLTVVLAGYDEPMRELLACNPGLESRVTTVLRFRSYAAGELAEIFARQAAAAGYDLAPDAAERVRETCELMCGSEDPETFGNAREVRNLFEDVVGSQAGRLVAMAEQGEVPDAAQLQRILAEDVRWSELGDPALEATLSEAERARVAYHEIGHALVSQLAGGPAPLLVTVVPSASAVGRVFFAEDRRNVHTRADLVALAARALAGRAAEEIALGAPSAGSAHDLERAERIVLGILRAGLSEEAAAEALSEFAATAGGEEGWHNESTRQEVAELLQEAHALAVRLLREHERLLDEAAAALAERRTLHREELAELFGQSSAAAAA